MYLRCFILPAIYFRGTRMAEAWGMDDLMGTGGGAFSGILINEPFISRSGEEDEERKKSAELRKGPCKKTKGTVVWLFECGTGWRVDGEAAWCSRFRAKFSHCEEVPKSSLSARRALHQCSDDEVNAYLQDYDDQDVAYLWHFSEVTAVPHMLRVKQPAEMQWVKCTENQLLDISRGTRVNAERS